jgi:hypothetical protein
MTSKEECDDLVKEGAIISKKEGGRYLTVDQSANRRHSSKDATFPNASAWAYKALNYVGLPN